MVNAINTKMDGVTKTFSDKVWAIISKNPRCPWVKVGTKAPIPVPGKVETIAVKKPIPIKKKEDVRVVESDLSMNELRAALKEKEIELPKHATKKQLKELYDNSK